MATPKLTQKTRRTLKTLGLLLMLAGTSACGSSAGNPNLFVAPESSSSGLYSPEGGDSSPCRSSPNVMPRHDLTLDGRDRYVACGDAERSDRFKLWGESSSGSVELCVFAALRNSGGQINILRETDGDLKMICGDVDPERGANFTFTDTTYNAVFVVPSSARAKMSTCLSANNPLGCPNYSFGQFR